MKHLSIVVRADWDEEASVWTASSNDIGGLAVEADTLEALEPKVVAALADLLELNGWMEKNPDHRSIPVHILAEQRTQVSLECA